MNDLDLIQLLEREDKEVVISLLVGLCQKNKNNRETIILLLTKK